MAIITIDNTKLFERQLEDALNISLLAAAQVGADKYFAEATKNQVEDPPVERSRPGQFPYRETGQGSDNIAAESVPSERAAGYGVRTDGMHLIWLTNRGRRGPIDIVKKYQGNMRQAFKKSMRQSFRARLLAA